MREPAILELLRRPEAYPGTRRDAPEAIDVIETHMSWVFLTTAYAYKLKKPVCWNGLDLRTADGRRRNCEAEIRLNRRLAPHVYLGVSAVTRSPDGTLALDGQGEPIDWLVRMRRLPAVRMLDQIVTGRRVTAEEGAIRATARHLVSFYGTAASEPLSGDAYRARLADGTRADLRELTQARYALPPERVETLARGQLALLESRPALFDRRVASGRIVEGHGDLRPEHVCVADPPAIIDCLEFDRDLRIVDPADELAFLALECERLGDDRPGRWCLDAYREATGDDPPAPLLRFHRVFRALRRATIAARHLDDPAVPDPERFAAKARGYLDLVEPVRDRGDRPATAPRASARSRPR